VQDAIGNQDVGLQQLRAVDVDVVSGVQDGDVLALLSEEFGSVSETGGVHYLVD